MSTMPRQACYWSTTALRAAVLVAVCNMTIPRMVVSMEWVGTKWEHPTDDEPIMGLVWDTSQVVDSMVHTSSSMTPSSTTASPHVVEVAMLHVMQQLPTSWIMSSRRT